MTAPDWLTVRNGALAPGLSEQTMYVTLNDDPQWRLDAVPARGTFTCAIIQTNSGKRLDAGKTYADRAAALAGGLEELRERLGW